MAIVELITTSRQRSTTKLGEEWDDNNNFLDSASGELIPSTDTITLTKGLLKFLEDKGVAREVTDENGNSKIVLYGYIQRDLPIGEEGDQVELRHISGYKSPFAKEQDFLKKRPNYGFDQATGREFGNLGNPKVDDIALNNGGLALDLTVVGDISRWNFMEICNYNADNEFRDRHVNPTPLFRVNDAKAAAVKYIQYIDLIEQAKQIVMKLRKGDTYDQAMIDMYTAIFKKDLGGLNSLEDKFVALWRMAQERPADLIKMVEKGKEEYYAVIQKAFDLNILVVDGDKVLNTETKSIEYTSNKGKITPAKAFDMLLYQYSSESGVTAFKALKNMVNTKLETK